MIAYFQRLLEHMFWADTELLELLDAEHAAGSEATAPSDDAASSIPASSNASDGASSSAPGDASSASDGASSGGPGDTSSASGGASSSAQGLAAVYRLYAHILAAERVWLLRLRREDSAVQPIWPTLGLDAMHELARRNAEGYARLLEELQDADIDVDVVYANSQGVPYRNSVSDILLHVALHGSYHRGQIAAALRAGGLEPVNTDFITFARL